MVDARWIPLRVAWQEALYGVDGFYRTNWPGQHFRTSAHVSTVFAEAIAELARNAGATSICDVGAGGGELLTELHRLEPTWALIGVDVRPRPDTLAGEVGWQQHLPTGRDGLLIANELLDDIPCDVVQLDEHARCRIVEVSREIWDERLGDEVDSHELGWLTDWWPLARAGDRAEIGLTRDALWTRICVSNPQAVCIAVDYGHCRADRPAGGSLTSFRAGMQAPVRYDGGHDISAHVAFDSLASGVCGVVRRQRDVLRDLGISGCRPRLDLATSDPRRYVRELSRATEAAELTEIGGLGDFSWVLSGPVTSPAPADPDQHGTTPLGKL
jgi:SAM-dependent MidA family methyltransferase